MRQKIVGTAHTASIDAVHFHFVRGKNQDKGSRKSKEKNRRVVASNGVSRLFFVWSFFFLLISFVFILFSLLFPCVLLFSNTNDGIADRGNFMRDEPFGLPRMHEDSASVASLWSLCCFAFQYG